jgi:chorismate synthase
MIALIDEVRLDRDSVGGVCELVAVGVPPGLGEPIFDKLKADLGKALLSLPAVLGFEYGAGFAVANMRGSANNDVFAPAVEPHESPVAPNAADCNATVWEPHHASIRTESNRHGGMLGGISSGMPIVCRAAIKPTSSIPRSQRTVTRTGEPTEILVRGRHDPCLLPRFVPMGEAMVALVLVDHLLRSRASRLS